MTIEDAERIAYIAGDIARAGLLAKLSDAESLVKDYESGEDAAYEEAFDKGRAAALVDDSDILDLQDAIKDLKTNLSVVKEFLNSVLNHLDSSDCKTIKGRVAFSKRLKSAMYARGWF